MRTEDLQLQTLATSVKRGTILDSGVHSAQGLHLVICLMSDPGVPDCRCCAGLLVTGAALRRLRAGPGRHASSTPPLGPPGRGLDCSGGLKKLPSGLSPCCWPDCSGKPGSSPLGRVLAKALLAVGALPGRLRSWWWPCSVPMPTPSSRPLLKPAGDERFAACSSARHARHLMLEFWHLVDQHRVGTAAPGLTWLLLLEGAAAHQGCLLACAWGPGSHESILQAPSSLSHWLSASTSPL